MRRLIVAGLIACFFAAALAQDTPSRKPVLIRDEAPPETGVELLPNPAEAKESLKIGQFYFKRKNYKAATDRFREAVRYLPTWDEPYDRLIESLLKQDATQEAIDVCDLFVATNPDSNRVGEFSEQAEKLKRELASKPQSRP